TFRFQPDMLRMWPAPNFGRPGPEWVKEGASGYYILHTDNPEFSGAVAIPRAVPGVLPPYQERPESYPLELKLSFDPLKDANLFFPLLVATEGANASLKGQLERFGASIPELYVRTQNYWAHFFDDRLTVETP